MTICSPLVRRLVSNSLAPSLPFRWQLQVKSSVFRFEVLSSSSCLYVQSLGARISNMQRKRYHYQSEQQSWKFNRRLQPHFLARSKGCGQSQHYLSSKETSKRGRSRGTYGNSVFVGDKRDGSEVGGSVAADAMRFFSSFIFLCGPRNDRKRPTNQKEQQGRIRRMCAKISAQISTRSQTNTRSKQTTLRSNSEIDTEYLLVGLPFAVRARVAHLGRLVRESCRCSLRVCVSVRRPPGQTDCD